MRKTILITIIILFVFRINAQTNVDSTAIYFNQKKYDKIINFVSKKGDYISLINIANQFFQDGNFKMTINFFLKSIEIGKNEMSLDQKATNYQLIGVSYFQLNDFKNAIYFLSNAYELSKSKLNESEEIALLNIIGICYESNNNFDYAIKNYNKAIKLNTRNSDEYFKSLRLLSNLKRQTQEFFIAEEQSKFFLNEAKKYLGESSDFYLSALNNLLQLYLHSDEYNLADKFCTEYIEINKNIFGDNSIETIKANSFLANLLHRQGKLIDAEKISIKILNNYNQYYNNEFISIALEYNQLALIQEELFKYDLAINSYLKAIEIIRNNYGETNEEYALLIQNLSGVYSTIKDFKEAEFYLKKAIEIKVKLNNTDIDVFYGNLASIYQETNRCEEAEKYFLKAIEFQKNKLSESYKEKILGLSLVYNCLKNPQKEFENLLRFSNIMKEKVIKNTLFMSNFELEMYIKKYITFCFYSHSSFSFLNNNPLTFNELNISKYDEELLLKNISLHNFQNLKNSINKSNDKELKDNYLKFINNKKQISKLTEIPEENKPLFYNDLILQTENLEKYLVEKSNEFSKTKKSLSLKWNQIQSTLNANEIAIEIVNYAYVTRENNLNDKNDNIYRYCAFILKKDSKFPKLISLFEEKKLDFLLERNKSEQDGTRIDKHYLERNISDLFLKPLEKELEGINTIYLSPAGLGHQIDLSALPINETQILGEKYKLHILSSPAELIDYKGTSLEKKSKIELLLYGGIDYTKSNGNLSLNVDDNSISSNEDFINSAKRSGFEKLPGTLKEVDIINANASKSGFSAKVFKKSEATEESIKALDGKTTPYVLHLATHGFFFPDPIQEIPKENKSIEGKSLIYKASEDPMMRSGLWLAGAKNYWGKSNPNNTIDDGILTASEISNLDLSACQLVVLSACETGLGEVKGSEGVFGLQRAFKMAGVKNIIMSLWKVPDTQTAELFDVFYSGCFAGKSIHEAFRSAQAKMKGKYSPYYWAGFVLLE